MGTPPITLAESTTVKERNVPSSALVADHLRRLILDDELLPGARIRQAAVAEELGVSRLPVRQGLQLLESEGLVGLTPNKGALVARLDLADCEAIYRLRERVEPLALRESMFQLTDDQIEQIESLRDEMEANSDINRFLALDREFHLLTYKGCTSECLRTTVLSYWNSTQHYRRAFMRHTTAEQDWMVVAEHRLLVEAIRRRDIEDAEPVLQGHIRRTRKLLARHPTLFDSPPT